MSNRIVIENLISSVRGYFEILKNYSGLTKDAITKDVTVRGAVERYLYLVTQSTIDLAEAIISYNKFRKPATYAESFHILEEMKIIDKILAEKMIKMTGFRNVIAHEYVKVDYGVLYDVLVNGVKDIEDFLKIAEAIK